MRKILASIIIPVKTIEPVLVEETIPAIMKQSEKRFEIIVIPDKLKKKDGIKGVRLIASWPKSGPADKRDLGAIEAKGKILAFLDDDSYPSTDWLKNSLSFFENEKVVGVCGPTLTPRNDSISQKVSGYVWSTRMGSGGAGTYRCALGQRRYVDDYPSVNLLVRKEAFDAIGGFDSKFWPGEDTKLCHDLVYRLKGKIIYDPKVLVFHHRRSVFIPHLRQISRYAIHRGHFARVLPKTSFRIGYFIPSLFVIFLFLGFPLAIFVPIVRTFYELVIGVYLFALLTTAISVFLTEKSLVIAGLVIPAIFATHIYYGLIFLKGFFRKNLHSKYAR